MKKQYMKPVIGTVEIGQTGIVCVSLGVINPGEPNLPAGSKQRGDTKQNEGILKGGDFNWNLGL